jgi:hypothetical protein
MDYIYMHAYIHTYTQRGMRLNITSFLSVISQARNVFQQVDKLASRKVIGNGQT